MRQDDAHDRPTCPVCHSHAVVPILYGLPSERGMEMARRGEVVLGGCMIMPGAPRWACAACHGRFGGRAVCQDDVASG